MKKRVVAAFDFDGTITKRDTLLPFLKQYGLGRMAKATLRTLVTQLDSNFRNTLKVNVLKELLCDLPADVFETNGRTYASMLPELYRTEILERIEFHRQKGHQLVLVTGSLGCYARPAALALGFDHVIAVEITSSLGRLTGMIEGENVRGREKVRRLKKFLNTEDIELWAYGNSSGDREMLEMADHAEMV
ncbi:MAG: HAD-IB family hydrolase [Acidimicrobiaceae bacterium]|nr:HAD-IB family hydrolase [Acidimicrobiaceae bacterium]|tara:strand:- start:2319 stop:2888 length:570 start_codon:yes stop_codon:yes gene_type:complete